MLVEYAWTLVPAMVVQESLPYDWPLFLATKKPSTQWLGPKARQALCRAFCAQ